MRIIIICIYIGVLHAHTRAAGGNPAPRRRQRGIPPFSADEEHAEAMRKLQALPRDASPTRLRNRDSIDGRPRAYNRKFGLSRINLREKAHKGKLPGVVKSSW